MMVAMTGTKISLLLTVKDEATNIEALLLSILQQSRRPDEIIIVDGGSTDDTLTILQNFAKQTAHEAVLTMHILEAPDSNISQGRNLAASVALGEILIITDAGLRLPVGWLAAITAPLFENEAIDVVSGFFRAAPESAFEAALGAVTLPLASEIDAANFLPSSRSLALRRAAFNAVNGYPEWLDYCEDIVFDLCLRSQGACFYFAPAACVDYRPRTTVQEFWRQYFRYARGDGKADLWRLRHAIRYFTYALATPLLLLLAIFSHLGFAALLILGVAIHLFPVYRRLPKVLRRLPTRSHSQNLQAWLWVAPLRILGDCAKMMGYPSGCFWRWRHTPPNWRQ